MGKKRAAAAPVFPFFPAAVADDDEEQPRHLSDYGFDDEDPRLRLFRHAERPAPAARRHQHRHQQPPPLESARFKLQKPISKKHHHKQQQQQRRRRWWSSAASAALLFFKRASSSSDPATTASAPCYGAAASHAGPLYYLADDEDEDAAAPCACWAPALRSGGHLAAAELGSSASVLPYVSLRDAGGGGAAPARPIYLVT